MKAALLVTLFASTCFGFGQSRLPAKISISDFESIAIRCAPQVDVTTLVAIAKTESAFQVDAISLNRPVAAARKAGWKNARVQLVRQPVDRGEAIRWMYWFSVRHYSVSVGLMQINIENASRYGYRPEQLFDPCTNVAVGGAILSAAYSQALQTKQGSDALLDSISLYNSGSSQIGYANGYVGSVVHNNTKRR